MPNKKIPLLPAADVASTYLPMENGGTYHRGSLHLVGAPGYNFEQLAENTPPAGVSPPRAAVAMIDDACIYGGGIVFKPQRWAVKESLINTKPNQQIDRIRRVGDDALETSFGRTPIWRRTSRRPHVMLKQTYDLNYGHWLVEGLPRVAVVAEQFDLRECAFIVSDRHGPAMAAVYRDSLRAFGIAARQIRPVGFRAVRVPQMIYPLPMTVHPWVKAPRTVRTLEEIGRRVRRGHVGPERIFVSRASVGTRRLVNESAIIDIVKAAGFKVIDPGRMTFDEQVQTFCNARFVVGTYGAALTNVVFAQQGVRLFSLAPAAGGIDFYYDLLAQKAGHYMSLYGQEPLQQSTLHADFTVDVEMFKRLFVDFLR